METELRITRANPAGNLTLLIEGDVPPERYAPLAARLLARPDCRAEQAGFLRPPLGAGAGRLEMSGGEFCGNAARSFGLLLAERKGLAHGMIPVEISGCSAPVRVGFDRDAGTAYADMPLPESIGAVDLPEPFGRRPLVRFEGIWHILAPGLAADRDAFLAARDAVYASPGAPAALGVMFLNESMDAMTPLVYVRGPETVYEESSCGSGTAAVAAWLAAERSRVTLRQPGGVLTAESVVDGGVLRSLRIGGPVSFEPPFTVTIEI